MSPANRIATSWSWLFVAACSATAATAPTPVRSPVAAGPHPLAVASASVVSPVVSVAASSASPPATAPPLPANPRLFSELPASDATEARHMGYSADDSYLGYEIVTSDFTPSEFRFTSLTQPPLDFAYYNDNAPPHDEAAKWKQDAEVEGTLRRLSVAKGTQWRTLRGPFPYPDLVFAKATDRNDFTGKVTLLFGARVDGYAPVFPVRIDLGPSPMFGTPMDPAARTRVAKLPAAERDKELRAWATEWLLRDPSVVYANVTRDGRELGVVALATGSLWFETADVSRISTKAFAARVYNDTGMRFHKASKFARAASLFEKAAAADPDDSLFAYNLACAYAKMKDSRAKDALQRAIARDGDEIRARARADADFAGVASDPWFRELVK